MIATGRSMGGELTRWATFQEAMSQPAVWRSWTHDLAAYALSTAEWICSRANSEIWFCGAGTSAFIGDTLCEYLNSMPGPARYRSIPTTDSVSCPRNFFRSGVRILVVSFGRSGDSPETIGTLDLLDEHFPQADRLNFTCNASGALAARKPPGPGSATHHRAAAGDQRQGLCHDVKL